LFPGIYNKNWFVDISHYKDKYISCHIDISIDTRQMLVLLMYW